jgi:hypothetical protein
MSVTKKTKYNGILHAILGDKDAESSELLLPV